MVVKPKHVGAILIRILM